MGNTVTKRKQFKIRNDTQFPVYVVLNRERRSLPVENIQPGFKGTLKKTVGDLLPMLNETLGRVLSDEEGEQKDRIIFELVPEKFGFKEIPAGHQYKSHKLWTKIQDFSGQPLFFTLLTRQFLIEGLRNSEGQERIDKNPVNSRSYNVVFYNSEQEGLDRKKRLVIAGYTGRLDVFFQ